LQDSPDKEKLVQKVIDFENLDVNDFKKERFDVVVVTVSALAGLLCDCTLRAMIWQFGIPTTVARSPKEFVRIDREYVLDVAKTAKVEAEEQIVCVGGRSQHFIVIPLHEA
ncbi:hypothetical protein FRB99_004535, partial [Tulasnella sp. 403]